MNQMLVDFARWLDAKPWSIGLHESFYMYNWIESTHVLTLMLSLGALCIIDLRMLGWAFKDVPASKLSARLATPMTIGFIIMFITGIILFTAIPVRNTQSIWFRIKMILLVVAAINAFLFHRHMSESVGSWDTAPVPPKRTRVGAAISLTVWALVVLCGRFIAYDWYDCGKAENSAFMNWAAGCNVTAADETH
jgi:uncharacterized membrane protein